MRTVVIVLLGLAWVWPGTLDAKDLTLGPEGPRVTIHSPAPRAFDVALDEADVEWPRGIAASGRDPSLLAVGTGRAVVRSRGHHRAVFSLANVVDLADLRAVVRAIEAANPGAEARIVLYEAGVARSLATRQALTRRVATVLAPDVDPASALADVPGAAIRPVHGAPRGYVVDAADPFDALDLAETLRQRPGVERAYPLLQRTYTAR